MNKNCFDLVIIGGGPAGLSSAVAACEEGIKNIMILEREKELGGILNQCIHTGFGLHIFKEELTGVEYAERFINKINDLKIEYLVETMVLDVKLKHKTPVGDVLIKKIIATNKKQGIMEIETKSLILAMGCRERTRGAINIPGDRPAGVFTAGFIQKMVNLEGYLPGKEIVILGSGDIGLIMARRLTFEGCCVRAVVEILPYPSGLTRNIVQCLEDYNIPLYLSSTIINIKGKDRVESVVISQVDEERNIIPHTEKEIKCDTVLLSVGLIPENELSKKINIKLHPITLGAQVNEFRETNIPGVFACGNVLQVHDIVDYVTEESYLAGISAAKYCQGILQKYKNFIEVVPESNISYILPHKITGLFPLKLFLRVKKPTRMIKINIKDTDISFSKPVARPAEMLEIELKEEHLKKIKKKKEIKIEGNF